MIQTLFLCFVILLFIVGVHNAPAPAPPGCSSPCCFVGQITGTVYNIISVGAGSVDYVFYTGSATNLTYFFNGCNMTHTCLLNPVGFGPASVCQRDGVGTLHSLGSLNTTLFTETTTGFTISYSGGDKGRSSTVFWSCNPDTPGNLTNVIDGTASGSYNVYFSSSAACPPGAGASSFDYGWLFPILLFGGLALYFAVGIIIQRFVREKSGAEMIPNVEFWSSLPGLTKDGVMFIVNKIRGQPGYTPV